MQAVTFVFLLVLVALASAQSADKPQVQLPLPKPHQPPTFPGYGSFNPHAHGGRFPRSPQNNGQVNGGVVKEGGKTSWNVEGSHKIWGNEHGSINVNAGANRPAGGHTNKHVGISGSFKWGK